MTQSFQHHSPMSYYFIGQNMFPKYISKLIASERNRRYKHVKKVIPYKIPYIIQKNISKNISSYYISNSIYRLAPLQNGPHMINYLTNLDQKVQKYTQANSCRHLFLAHSSFIFYRYRTMCIKLSS